MSEPWEQPTQQPYAPEMPMELRRQALYNAVAQEVARGGRVESQTDLNAIIVRGSKPNHVLHLILTLVTCLAWSVVWIALVVIQQEHRTQLTVDPYGQVLLQRLS